MQGSSPFDSRLHSSSSRPALDLSNIIPATPNALRYVFSHFFVPLFWPATTTESLWSVLHYTGSNKRRDAVSGSQVIDPFRIYLIVNKPTLAASSFSYNIAFLMDMGDMGEADSSLLFATFAAVCIRPTPSPRPPPLLHRSSYQGNCRMEEPMMSTDSLRDTRPS